MKKEQVNSLNKREDNRCIWPLWVSTQLDAEVHQLDCEVDSGAGYSIMPQYICGSLFKEKKPELPTFLINGYGDSQVKIKDHAQLYSSLEVRHHRKQCSRSKAQEVSSSSAVKTAQQTGYIYFPR